MILIYEYYNIINFKYMNTCYVRKNNKWKQGMDEL